MIRINAPIPNARTSLKKPRLDASGFDALSKDSASTDNGVGIFGSGFSAGIV
jgi:hypothetical protein